ncbi:unnamed protein product [Prunus armeniaca]|uniref:Piwi domain-containing protein n=1 Tax=Prunus armeniaca TaxID=36596 RepID=A0A6J5XRE3_PRUAR|nr:unnamed protein product [Prunus armeniaca]
MQGADKVKAQAVQGAGRARRREVGVGPVLRGEQLKEGGGGGGGRGWEGAGGVTVPGEGPGSGGWGQAGGGGRGAGEPGGGQGPPQAGGGGRGSQGSPRGGSGGGQQGWRKRGKGGICGRRARRWDGRGGRDEGGGTLHMSRQAMATDSSRYRASVRTQSPKVEMIDSLYKRISESEDDGIMRELLLDFYTSSGKQKPDQIIIFRDGVSESQFNQVLNIELDQIIEACKFLDESWNPKFVVIIAQKNHHTKFFQPPSPDNVPPGTIIDNKVCHPRNNDFYLCAQAGMIGTTRPTHYHVLLDEVGFSADDLQELVHSLSYVYQRSTTAISVVAPVCYAHLAATQMGQFMKFEDASETSSSHGGVTSAGAVPVPQLPRLKENVSSSMFFC